MTSRVDEFNMLCESVKGRAFIMELFLGIVMIVTLIFSYLQSSVLLLIVAILVWIVHILIKTMNGVYLILTAKVVELEQLDKKRK